MNQRIPVLDLCKAWAEQSNESSDNALDRLITLAAHNAFAPGTFVNAKIAREITVGDWRVVEEGLKSTVETDHNDTVTAIQEIEADIPRVLEFCCVTETRPPSQITEESGRLAWLKFKRLGIPTYDEVAPLLQAAQAKKEALAKLTRASERTRMKLRGLPSNLRPVKTLSGGGRSLSSTRRDGDGASKPSEAGHPASLAYKDAPLLQKMRDLMGQGEAKSPWDAALAVADKAAGIGSSTTKAKRLLKRYKQISSR